MKRIIAVSILLMGINFLGCASKGPVFETLTNLPSSKAIVYIYRPNFFYASVNWPTIYINNIEKFDLKKNGHGILFLSPGSHIIDIKGDWAVWTFTPARRTIVFKAGEEYYFRVNPVSAPQAFPYAGHTEFTLVNKEEALNEIKGTRRVYLDDNLPSEN